MLNVKFYKTYVFTQIEMTEFFQGFFTWCILNFNLIYVAHCVFYEDIREL